NLGASRFGAVAALVGNRRVGDWRIAGFRFGFGSRVGGRRLTLGRFLVVELRPDVVAVLVEALLAVDVAVFGGDGATLGGLLDRQRDAAALEVDVDDLDPELL